MNAPQSPDAGEAQPPRPPTSTCAQCGAALATDVPGCVACMLLGGFEENEDVASGLPALAAPERFGHYEIVRRESDGSLWELGRGAMGITYRALDSTLRVPVALKVIAAAVAGWPEARDRFLREARAAARLRHPNVASVFHFGVRPEDGQCFYAMELVEGETLEARVARDGPLPATLALDVAAQVAAALVAAEEQGLVHRDLKPSNLMLAGSFDPDASDARTVVKVIDFGLAKAVAATGVANVEAEDGDHTRGGFVGTPAFASPEQIDQRTRGKLDARSDIYSLGVTLWFLLCGKPLFSGRLLDRIHERQLRQPLPLGQLAAAGVPDPVMVLLRHMLAPDPAKRPQSARELARAIRRCREQSVSPPWFSRRRSLSLALAGAAVIGLALLAGVSLYYQNRKPSPPPATATATDNGKSIAVLPFQILGAEDKERDFFAGGIQDEILAALMHVADLKVIARTSVASYKPEAERDPRAIGRALGVALLLEGSVQHGGENRVRVRANLIDARSGAYLWADHHEGSLADIFSIQSRIAQRIAAQLRAELSPGERAAIARPPTRDVAAYGAYLRARQLLANFQQSADWGAVLREAVSLSEKAIERDPQFALAYCQLAEACDQLAWHRLDPTPGNRARADAAVESAARLRPDSGEAHLARGHHFYYAYREFDWALQELELARASLPNESKIPTLIGYIARRQGRWDQATRNFERACDLDPRNLNSLYGLANVYRMQRRYEDVRRVLDRMETSAVGADDIDAWIYRAWTTVEAEADLAPLRAALAAVPTHAANTSTVPFYRFRHALYVRDAAAAAAAYRAAPTTASGYRQLDGWDEALVARLRGDADAERATLRAARETVDTQLREKPDDARLLSRLGLIDAALGERDAALRAGRRAVELLPVEKDALYGPDLLVNLALIHARVGEADRALEELARLINLPAGPSYGELRLDPVWDPLRNEPRFEALVSLLAPLAHRGK